MFKKLSVEDVSNILIVLLKTEPDKLQVKKCFQILLRESKKPKYCLTLERHPDDFFEPLHPEMEKEIIHNHLYNFLTIDHA